MPPFWKINLTLAKIIFRERKRDKKTIFGTFLFLYLIQFFPIPLLPFFSPILSKTKTQEQFVQDIGNKGNPSQLPSIDVSQIGGEIPQKDQNNPNS